MLYASYPIQEVDKNEWKAQKFFHLIHSYDLAGLDCRLPALSVFHYLNRQQSSKNRSSEYKQLLLYPCPALLSSNVALLLSFPHPCELIFLSFYPVNRILIFLFPGCPPLQPSWSFRATLFSSILYMLKLQLYIILLQCQYFSISIVHSSTHPISIYGMCLQP